MVSGVLIRVRPVSSAPIRVPLFCLQGAGFIADSGITFKLPWTPTLSRKHMSRTRIARSQPAVQFSVGWYTEQEWAKVRAAAADPELFEASYAEWVDMAARAVSDLHAQGFTAEKSYITADKLLAWCLAHGKQNNSASRAEFVSQQARANSEPGV